METKNNSYSYRFLDLFNNDNHNEEYEAILPVVESLAESGDKIAQFVMGIYYSFVDSSKSYDYFIKASKQGCYKSMFNLAYSIYDEFILFGSWEHYSDIFPKDCSTEQNETRELEKEDKIRSEILRLMETAAENGIKPALCFLMTYYTYPWVIFSDLPHDISFSNFAKALHFAEKLSQLDKLYTQNVDFLKNCVEISSKTPFDEYDMIELSFFYEKMGYGDESYHWMREAGKKGWKLAQYLCIQDDRWENETDESIINWNPNPTEVYESEGGFHPEFMACVYWRYLPKFIDKIPPKWPDPIRDIGLIETLDC